jgi:tRNA 2-thiouridine synthesizing protein D
MKSLLIYCTHGTYGRDDDAFGALLAANAALAKGMSTTLVLVEDGVCLAKKGQNPGKIGLPNNLAEINDFMELGGRLIALQGALEDRGMLKDELVEGVEVIPIEDAIGIIEQHSLSLTF